MELNMESVKLIVEEYIQLHDYSPCTLTNRLQALKKFHHFMSKEKRIRDFKEVTEKHYYEFMKYLTQKGNLKEITLMGLGIGIKKIFDILEEEEKILVNPFHSVKTIKCRNRIRDVVLSEEEIKRMLESFNISRLKGFKDRVILEILYGTGLRISELIELQLCDYFKAEKMLLVKKGKGKKERLLPLGESLHRIINEYLQRYRPKYTKYKKSKYLLVRGNGKKLTRAYVSTMLRKTAKKVGIAKKVCVHTIRHSYASHLIEGGADIRHVQILLGHSSISSTQIYVTLNKQYLKKEYEKYHPLENELYYDVANREEKAIKGLLKKARKVFKKSH